MLEQLSIANKNRLESHANGSVGSTCMNESETPQQARVKYIFSKSSLFRVVHADGVWGGVTPTGAIRMGFFNEGGPLPEETVHPVKAAATGVEIGPEIPELRIGKKGISRELEVDAVLTLEAAELVHEWLGKRIAQAKEMRAKVQKRKEA